MKKHDVLKQLIFQNCWKSKKGRWETGVQESDPRMRSVGFYPE